MQSNGSRSIALTPCLSSWGKKGSCPAFNTRTFSTWPRVTVLLKVANSSVSSGYILAWLASSLVNRLRSPCFGFPLALSHSGDRDAARASRYDISRAPAALSGKSVPQKRVRKTGAFLSSFRNLLQIMFKIGICSASDTLQSVWFLTTPRSNSVSYAIQMMEQSPRDTWYLVANGVTPSEVCCWIVTCVGVYTSRGRS